MSVGKPGQAFVLAARLSRPRRAIAQVGRHEIGQDRKGLAPMVGPKRLRRHATPWAASALLSVSRCEAANGFGQVEMPRALGKHRRRARAALDKARPE